MEIQATSKYARISPRKMQLLAKSIIAMSARQATTTLGFINKSGAIILQKVIASAIANAKNRANVAPDELIIKQIQVLPGSAMKRFRAVSRGMAHEYKKRMSHIKVILAEKPKVEITVVQKEKTEEKTKKI